MQTTHCSRAGARLHKCCRALLHCRVTSRAEACCPMPANQIHLFLLALWSSSAPLRETSVHKPITGSQSALSGYIHCAFSLPEHQMPAGGHTLARAQGRKYKSPAALDSRHDTCRLTATPQNSTTTR